MATLEAWTYSNLFGDGFTRSKSPEFKNLSGASPMGGECIMGKIER